MAIDNIARGLAAKALSEAQGGGGGGSETQQLYRAGLVFKNKNTGEKYIVVCTTSENVEDFDWGDPNIFNKYCEQAKYGDLVIKEVDSDVEEIGIVTTPQANSITIKMLSNGVLDTVIINSTDFEQWDSYYNTPYYIPSNE